MKKKISLQSLNVKSFTTENIKKKAVQGGGTGSNCFCTVESQCNLCEGTEEASICCPPKQ